MGQTFGKADRVRQRGEFLLIQRLGRRTHTPHFVLLYRDRADGGAARLGLVTSRKVANAVGRNRVRRLLREVFRCHREKFPPGHDVVVIARPDMEDLALTTVRDEILAALARRRASTSTAGPPKGGRTS